MIKHSGRILTLSVFTLLCTHSLQAEVFQTIAERTSAQLGVATGNLLAEQSYLDNYPDDYGNGPLTSYNLTSTYKLIDHPIKTMQLEFYQDFYPKIDSYVLGSSLVYRLHPSDGYRHGYYFGLDYMAYDQLEFTQAALGYELHIYDLDANMTLTIPFTSSQHYASTSSTNPLNAQLLAMNGFDLRASKTLYAFDFLFQGAYYWHNSTKQPFVGASVGVDYRSPYATLGIMQQYRNGVDSEQQGTRIFAQIPLLKAKPKYHHSRLMTMPV